MAGDSTILIVDDEPFNVEILEQELQHLGYRTLSAGDGEEALEVVANELPDLVLLDIMMPVMDGFSVCRQLKADSRTRLIPVVMLTALDGFDDRIKGIEAGADDFLTKPVNERELQARLRTTLRQKHAIDQSLGEVGQIRDHFAKFVPDTVKRLVEENPDDPELEKRERDVTVLFLDISGYARLCERLPVEQVNGLVERYFSAFLDLIQEAGGDISETAGDGIMVIFGDGVKGEHAAVAADTAFRLLAETEALNSHSEAEPLAVHMGLNSGAALVGSTRIEGRRGARWTFTASGPVTNLAARLAGFAESGQIALGPETARRLDGGYRLDCRGAQSLKNMSDSVEVHLLLGPEAAENVVD